MAAWRAATPYRVSCFHSPEGEYGRAVSGSWSVRIEGCIARPASVTEFRRVRFPTLGEGGTQFLRLVGIQVAAEQQVMCHPGETANATMASGERGLARCQSERAAGGRIGGRAWRERGVNNGEIEEGTGQ